MTAPGMGFFSGAALLPDHLSSCLRRRTVKIDAEDSSTPPLPNWCEELPGIPHSDAVVARILRMMGFTFTGSSSSVLELSWDKEKVKRFLEQNGLPEPL